MGKKYIIELNPDCVEGEYLRIPARIAGEQQWLVTKAALTPCTELDLEQVRKEAYEKGYEDGFVAGHLKAEKSGQSFYEDGYQRGMADANRDGEYNADDGWYVMQKISLLPNPIKTELFGTAETAVILQDNSFKDALDKLTEYEQEEEEQIQVGDEVEWSGDRYVVTYIDVDETYVDVIDCSCGSVCDRLAIKSITKTGRHFPEIAAVIEKMRGEKE